MLPIHKAISSGCVRSCHDLSEGGLAVAAAEMAFAGELGVSLDLSNVPRDEDVSSDALLLFAESNTRFVVEVAPDKAPAFSAAMGDTPHAKIGEVNNDGRLRVIGDTAQIDASLDELKSAWQAPLANFA